MVEIEKNEKRVSFVWLPFFTKLFFSPACLIKSSNSAVDGCARIFLCLDVAPLFYLVFTLVSIQTQVSIDPPMFVVQKA